MSNPPFGNPVPLNNSDDDFTFQVETPNNPLENQPFNENEITPDYLASNPEGILSEYQDLSMFLDDHQEEEEVGGVQQLEVMIDDDEDEDGSPSAVGFEVGQGSSSSTRKLDHNAKERARRMKLNATFMALSSLLPLSRRPKNRWSAPYVIDKALDYIPQLQNEIQKLTLEKDNYLLSVTANMLQVPVTVATTSPADDQHVMHNNQLVNTSSTLTVSINHVKEGEFIIQICQDKDKAGGVLTTLFDKFEARGIQVVGASSLFASPDRSCFHIHIQMSENPQESDYVAILHQKIISWLS